MNEIDEDDFPEVDFRPNDFVEEDRAQVIPEGNVVPGYYWRRTTRSYPLH